MSWYKYYSLIDKFGYQNVNINNNKINKLKTNNRVTLYIVSNNNSDLV